MSVIIYGHCMNGSWLVGVGLDAIKVPTRKQMTSSRVTANRHPRPAVQFLWGTVEKVHRIGGACGCFRSAIMRNEWGGSVNDALMFGLPHHRKVQTDRAQPLCPPSSD